MKIKYIYILIILNLFFNIVISKSEDCKFLCPDVDWQFHGYEEIYDFIFPNCKVGIYYSYRYLDCPELSINWCDYKFDSLIVLDRYGCGPALNQLPLFWVTQEAVIRLLEKVAKFSECGIGLQPGDSTSFISINYGGCWTKDIYNPSHSLGLYPCNENHCCRQIWKIKREISGLYSVPVLISQYGITFQCESIGCISICEDLHLWKDNTEYNLLNNTEIVDKAIVYPNPSAEKFSILFSSNIKGRFIIEFYDILGQLIYSEDFIKNETDALLNFESKNWLNNQYLFFIKNNEKIFVNGEVKIIK